MQSVIILEMVLHRRLKTQRFIDETIGLEGVQDAFTKLTDPMDGAVKNYDEALTAADLGIPAVKIP